MRHNTSRHASLYTRSGFTLVEVLVALAIGAILLLGARAILEQLADTADRMSIAARTADYTANTERAVRTLIERTTAADDANPFTGDEASAHFTAWCDVPAGWLERCTVTVEVTSSTQASARDSTPLAPSTSHTTLASLPPFPNTGRPTPTGPLAVIVRTSTGDTFRLRDSLPYATLRYLVSAAHGGQWNITWPPGMTTPLALGVITARDTLVLPIGERR